MAKLSGAGAVAPSLLLCCCCCVLIAVLAGQPAAGDDAFERTVFEMVNVAIRGNATVQGDPRVGPALIRLLFHDCWVNGCDGSVLLDKTPADGARTEKTAARSIGLGGFDLIDAIKARLAAAGGGASCADILAFAARDAATVLSGGRIRYAVRRGRGDGVASSAEAADAALPGPVSSFAELEESFAARGLGKGDLAALSGAHAVGACHGSSFADRLRPSVAAAYQINGTYQLALVARQKLLLLQNASDSATTMMNNVRDMDPAFRAASSYSGVGVDTAAAGALDNSYYTANLQNMVLLKSDWELTQDEDTLARLVAYRDDAARWNKDFGEAMERLSSLRPPVGARLEIRKTCRLTNLSPGRAVVHALKSFLRRRYDQISGLLKYFNAGLM
ncbi:hypothetical protein PAHAL_3G108300 [Panicum hallii]|uniref:Peroxidase n=1 Tax=Panicum hallii TaxID=206008 RepID=A0A2S3H845_9POAL|nr:peroxidase 2-like [Panicum hallii]PAN17113.1 hypothetical protein PAHAL_3G108300 [Panicum hallii]